MQWVVFLVKCIPYLHLLNYNLISKQNTQIHICSFVVEEVIDFYNRNDSPLYLVTLDASRAFDRVEYNKLFQLLIDRNICSLYALLLINMYTRLKLRVRWNGKCSEVFSVCNGVKQGSILSPILFCIYIDVLLERLKQASV